MPKFYIISLGNPEPIACLEIGIKTLESGLTLHQHLQQNPRHRALVDITEYQESIYRNTYRFGQVIRVTESDFFDQQELLNYEPESFKTELGTLTLIKASYHYFSKSENQHIVPHWISIETSGTTENFCLVHRNNLTRSELVKLISDHMEQEMNDWN